MIKISDNIGEATVRLGNWISRVGGGDRKVLFSAAADAVCTLVRSHLSRLASWRHKWADELHAKRTGFLQDAATGTVFNATENYGEVVIPAPLGRAFHDVEIKPKTWQYLTIPAAAEAYGKKAFRLKSEGWSLYVPPNQHFMVGYKKGVGSKILYWLKESVHQSQDRSLLPSDKDIQQTAAAAIMATIKMRIAS